ncbi:GntR family transcriptional regulator, partial [Kitasatospora sp. A2-31]
MSDGDDVSPYLRIADGLRTRIAAGEFQPGDRLPSLADLRREHGYSTAVGQSAYRVLEQDGLVVARQGRGYFVRSPEPPPVLVRRQRVAPGEGSPTEATLARQGVAGTWRHESQPRAADDRIAARLEIRPGDPVMHTSYVYLADGEPTQLAESWEPMAVTGGS